MSVDALTKSETNLTKSYYFTKNNFYLSSSIVKLFTANYRSISSVQINKYLNKKKFFVPPPFKMVSHRLAQKSEKKH
ncbi:hypothetical protein BpHYR1_044204 [Brachionus plicatilis]|uniref:Uncharacterized protein n=1 Tax=Brachionus plicatilis TaxID=10195 RepID=A0A3M7PE43_BRAPC|nr:hypothetical protein BpHYR1_044204 [Brachionus plicatilis]